MSWPAALIPDDTRFFDGGDDTHPPDPGKPPSYEFVRVEAHGRERFRALRRIGYRTHERPGVPSRTFIVPENLHTWTTDFASVPWLFAWLVPKSGRHLPASLLHDALVARPGNYIGPRITRDDADVVFKEAMADLGTRVVRRWLIWTAVTLATIFLRQVGAPRSHARWYYVVAGAATLALTVYFGAIATLDVLGVGRDWAWVYALPWMSSSSTWGHILQGAAGAVVIPVLLGLLWGRFWRAGMIAGVALAFLLHVTFVILVLTGLYWGLEKVGEVDRGHLLLAILAIAFVGAAVIFIRALQVS